jgi:hypothetical protein
VRLRLPWGAVDALSDLEGIGNDVAPAPEKRAHPREAPSHRGLETVRVVLRVVIAKRLDRGARDRAGVASFKGGIVRNELVIESQDRTERQP